MNEPFDLRYRPRHALVIDRLAWWYFVPREWLKKISLMDDVYLLNNPFTFQAMEKHSAYCAMMRLGLNVPETWLIPHKEPPRSVRFESATARWEAMATRYNAPFDLDEIAGTHRLPALHEAVRRRPVGRRHARRVAGRAARGATTSPASGSCTCRRPSRTSTSSSARSPSAPRRWSCATTRPSLCTRATGRARLPLAGRRRRGGRDLAARQRLLPLGVQLVRDAGEGRRRLSDRLRQRVAGRRAHLAALLLPVGDQGARPLVRRSAPSSAGACASTRTRAPTSTSATATTSTYAEKLDGYRELAEDYFDVDHYREFCDDAPGPPRRGHGRVRREPAVRRR